MVVYRLGIYGLLSDFTRLAQGKQAMILEFLSLITFVSIWQKKISGWMFVLSKIMNTSTLYKTVDWTGKKNKASAIRNCSMLRLLTLPSAGCQSINNLTPLCMTKGSSYPYKVIHRLWITFNFFSEKIFKFFQNVFPIQVHRIYNRNAVRILVQSGFTQVLLSYNS